MHEPGTMQGWYEPPSITGWLREGWKAFRAEAGVFIVATLAYLAISLTPSTAFWLMGRRHWWDAGPAASHFSRMARAHS